MDDRLSRASTHPPDPHQWQTFERYQVVHAILLEHHHFIDETRPHTLVFRVEERDGVLQVYLEGDIYCRQGVSLIVEIVFDTRYVGGLLQIRGHTYRYIGYIPGDTWVLKYHNLHEDQDEYIHRVRNPATGRVQSETLARRQFPVMSEVLDELEIIAGRYSS